MKILLFTFLSLFITGLTQISLAAEPKKRPAQLRLTFEEIDLPGNEKMGLLGSSYLVQLNRHLYAGLGIYSAVTGERGGFFTGGLETGVKYKLGQKLELDAGLFVGGGGGGAAPQGGGLMLRPQVGIYYHTPTGKLGLQVSKVKFPNGEIDSNQVAVSYEKPLSLLQVSQWLEAKRLKHLGSRFFKHNRPAEQDFSVLAQTYNLPDGTLNTAGIVQDADVSLLGVEWDYYFGKRAFFRLQTLGALGGDSDGYASVLIGLGQRYQLAKGLDFKIGATLGASGGGRIATGGGFTSDIAMNLQYRLGNGLLAGLRAGYVHAPDGEFEATSLGAYIGYGDRAPVKKRITARDIKPRHWRIRATHQTYIPTGDTRRKGQTQPDNRDVHLVAMQADIMTSKHLYITGQAIGAYDGGAGGYAVGLVGVGTRFPLWPSSRLEFNAEGLIGAAGGGGLAVGDGLVGQVMAGLAYRSSRSTSLHLALGRFESLKGRFEADVVNLSFAYRFTTFAWR